MGTERSAAGRGPRVFALDQRGHGDSQRRPDDVSRTAYIGDCAATIAQLGLGPVTLIGQSMGANTAMLTAAEHPELVRSLVIIEASPDGPESPDPEPDVAAEIRDAPIKAALEARPRNTGKPLG